MHTQKISYAMFQKCIELDELFINDDRWSNIQLCELIHIKISNVLINYPLKFDFVYTFSCEHCYSKYCFTVLCMWLYLTEMLIKPLLGGRVLLNSWTVHFNILSQIVYFNYYSHIFIWREQSHPTIEIVFAVSIYRQRFIIMCVCMCMPGIHCTCSHNVYFILQTLSSAFKILQFLLIWSVPSEEYFNEFLFNVHIPIDPLYMKV